MSIINPLLIYSVLKKKKASINIKKKKLQTYKGRSSLDKSFKAAKIFSFIRFKLASLLLASLSCKVNRLFYYCKIAFSLFQKHSLCFSFL